MTQSELNALREQVRKQELAALVTLIDAAKAIGEAARGSASGASAQAVALDKSLAVLTNEFKTHQENYKKLESKVDAINQARWTAVVTVTVALFTTIGNILIAVLKAH